MHEVQYCASCVVRSKGLKGMGFNAPQCSNCENENVDYLKTRCDMFIALGSEIQDKNQLLTENKQLYQGKVNYLEENREKLVNE